MQDHIRKCVRKAGTTKSVPGKKRLYVSCFRARGLKGDGGAVPSRPEIVRVAQSSGNAAKNLDGNGDGGTGPISLGNSVIRRPEKCDRH